MVVAQEVMSAKQDFLSRKQESVLTEQELMSAKQGLFSSVQESMLAKQDMILDILKR
jgi:hypothetical protein